MHNLHLNISSLPFFNHADTEINPIYRFCLGQKAGGGCCQSLGHAQDGRQLPARVSQKQTVHSPHGRTVLTTIITRNTQHPLVGKAQRGRSISLFFSLPSSSGPKRRPRLQTQQSFMEYNKVQLRLQLTCHISFPAAGPAKDS